MCSVQLPTYLSIFYNFKFDSYEPNLDQMFVDQMFVDQMFEAIKILTG